MSPVTVPAKGKYMMTQDLPRFANLYQVPLGFNPHFPINTLNLMRGAVAALGQDYFDHLCRRRLSTQSGSMVKIWATWK